ncbi:MAG: cellulase family glycosylhydrolase [Armatimonadetes bacterium]|nr:cellulase family glycosylhydrolase [Armatimonadota bacterium]
MMRLILFVLSAVTLGAPVAGRPAPQPSAPALLPAGYLSVLGSQFVGPDGRPVRVACVGGFGTVIVGHPSDPGDLCLSSYGPYKGTDANIAAVKSVGFNCIRVDFIDKSVGDPVLMAEFDQLVAACKKYGIKIIFDNHNNEATPADWANAAQQKNGLWFDTGPGTDGTDGTGTKGTVSAAQFQQDWVTFARHWAHNPTVIGFDIRNEPLAGSNTSPSRPAATWGGGGPTDIHAMYQDVGNAILAVNPDALIICEGFQDYGAAAYEGNLAPARTLPVALRRPRKLVYSVHEYPREIGGYPGAESGPEYVARMNRTWGWLVSENVAPVWIGEMGASMQSAASRAWGETLLAYMNGESPGGLTFSGNQQPASGDWWCWGDRRSENPDGCLSADGKVRPEQAPFIAQMLFRPKGSTQKEAARVPVVLLTDGIPGEGIHFHLGGGPSDNSVSLDYLCDQLRQVLPHPEPVAVK